MQDTMLEKMLDVAKSSAEQGLVKTVLYNVGELNRYAVINDIAIPTDEIKGIIKSAYDNGIKYQLEHAKESSKEGEVKLMQLFIRHAQDFAKEVQYNIPEQTINEINMKGYEKAIDKELSHARKYAGKNNLDKMEDAIKEALYYATFIKKDISKKVNEIRESIK